jgi:hypothetical protein
MPTIRLKKYKERLKLTLLIKSRGITMPPCSYYKKHLRTYVVSYESSSRYNEYVRRGIKYDVASPLASNMAAVL